jgi:hypothetical protein
MPKRPNHIYLTKKQFIRSWPTTIHFRKCEASDADHNLQEECFLSPPTSAAIYFTDYLCDGVGFSRNGLSSPFNSLWSIIKIVHFNPFEQAITAQHRLRQWRKYC